MKTNQISRRHFFKKTALTTGVASLTPLAVAGCLSSAMANDNRSSHEVWIAGVSQAGLRAKTPELMVEKILGILQEVVPYKPDFICLPEAFAFENIDARLTFPEMVEFSNKVLVQFSAFSKENNCYTIC